MTAAIRDAKRILLIGVAVAAAIAAGGLGADRILRARIDSLEQRCDQAAVRIGPFAYRFVEGPCGDAVCAGAARMILREEAAAGLVEEYGLPVPPDGYLAFPDARGSERDPGAANDWGGDGHWTRPTCSAVHLVDLAEPATLLGLQRKIVVAQRAHMQIARWTLPCAAVFLGLAVAGAVVRGFWRQRIRGTPTS